MNLDLQSRTCVVTGASAGIGRGIAKVLAKEGVRLAVVGRRKALLEELASEIQGEGGARPLLIAEDLASSDGPAKVAKQALAEFGRVDILVSNAGASRPIELESGPATELIWEEAHALNFTAGRRLADALLPGMRAAKWGRIVNVTGYMEPRHLNAAYSAKAAMNVWAKALSVAVAKDGVAINCIAPGLIKSEQILGRILPDEQIRQSFVDANIPIGYLGEPEDIGNLVAFLSSPLAGYITGALIPVDGGMHYYAG
ncbi:SDR family NAD(P)-dependent oxidoreductase [Ottowia thiooxydans]|uniref:SDR family NAD(P)-dependent oxidoreductase n=1 Tax=Ottowia thiooxydans TaxID=219182 RepID=UPI0003FDCAC7|nr:SDR family oxidoreductase [Ottowia thiooxydans]